MLSSVATAGHPSPGLSSLRNDPLTSPEEVREEENGNSANTVIIKAAPDKAGIDGLPWNPTPGHQVADFSASASPESFTPSSSMSTSKQISLETLERGGAAALYFEQLYHGILKGPRGRDQRRMQLEKSIVGLSESEKREARDLWQQVESEHLRLLRTKIHVGSFIKLKIVGHGAFGVVTLVQERSTGQLYAMKQLRKADMLRKGQEVGPQRPMNQF